MKNQRVKIKRNRYVEERKVWVSGEVNVKVMDKYKTKEGETMYLGKDDVGNAVRFSPVDVIAFLSAILLIILTAI